MERGHREMYRVWIEERGKYGVKVYTARREKTSFAREGWRGKGMNGDCRPRGRDEWPGTRGGNGGETRARRENPREEANEDGRREAERRRGGRKRGMNEEGGLFRVDNHRQHSSGSTHGVMSTTRDAAA